MTLLSANQITATKNSDLEYEYASKALANLVGFKQDTDLIGLTDADLNCKAADSFAWFQNHDKLVSKSGAHLSLLSFNQYADGWHLLFTQKFPPLCQSNTEERIIITTCDITNLSLINMGVLMNDVFSKKIINREAFSFQIDSSYASIDISKQESQCLFYFFHGYTIKLIAKELKISPATVETYLNRIKHKLGCTKRSQIIEKMHHLNWGRTLIMS